MRANLTHSMEDYLKAIYILTAAGGRASTNDIAARMGVTPASTTGMVQKLAGLKPPLLEYQKHHGVALTFEGTHVALEVIRHHRLLELFLYQNLGYSWDEVHAEADRLEHVISEEFEERIAQVLGNPQHDPHGEPIPSRELVILPESGVRLSELQPPQRATILRVGNTDPEFLRYLGSQGLVPQARLTILDYSPFDDNLHLLVEGQDNPLVLGLKVTHQIYVEVV